MPHRTPVLIATYLEPEYVDRIAAVDDTVEVRYEPDLLPVPRYRCDHGGTPRALDETGRRRWEQALADSEVSFDFDWQAPEALPTRAPRLRWVQATSAGIGGFVERTGLDRTDLRFTTAAGIHAVPLAEFALTGALHFVKGLPHLRRQQRDHRWQRYTTSQLAGRTVCVVGLGGIGRQVAATFAALGTRVVGLGRPGRDYGLDAAVEVRPVDDLDQVLPGTDVLVLCTPLTAQTTGLIGARQLAALPDGAVLVNIARGPVVDEPALVEALTSGRLGGACLDVFSTEPLPGDSPLWDLDNVLVSPHSASTVATENATLTDLFCDNLRRYLDGRPLRNPYRRELGY
ncbi:D-2-hydroxyacid dehydrogenase [Micromonospora sp. 067-2]|uniref:D-2-hydroxyacid dehydrogenase n=1 Tax=Micromonospora sp. 067-2 TaxID=2789270 RepID=UPI00397BAD07